MALNMLYMGISLKNFDVSTKYVNRLLLYKNKLMSNYSYKIKSLWKR